jgi:exo-beta-1,3-glucanase (GH17 family)
MRWWVGVAIGLVVVIAIVAGIVGGVLGTRNSAGSSDASSSNDNNANTDTATNGDLSKNSAEIQALMNNKDLHKVFPGIDYTPWGTQYPLCFTYPPSQNNVTRDMAVLSQLTNTVRLYGTDCNQTQMVLHAIDRLELTDMKVWMGVWIDTNTTTNDRQLAQMYSILEDTDDISVFKGVIVGNEALYRAGEDKAQSEQELITILTDVKSKFKTKGYDLPVATSDLGDNWNAELVQVVDYVMSNIHPFFAGVTAEVGASWTWDFWQTHDVVLTEGVSGVGQVISETGWPSGGGTDCGGSTGECATGQSGSVAGVDGMNTFMDNWVCQALANGTEYFW